MCVSCVYEGIRNRTETKDILSLYRNSSRFWITRELEIRKWGPLIQCVPAIDVRCYRMNLVLVPKRSICDGTGM